MSHQVATGLLKNYVEGLATQDTKLLQEVLEPSFFKRLEPNLAEVKRAVDAEKASFFIEKFRDPQTDFFLYNVENIMLVGVDCPDPRNRISADRTLNRPKEHYEI